ncbi:PREDICTED: uncharacterized protein LOC109470962 [Branchiostoma belcheri]|uniref:Uncharacterized protein LOC109470962 n=1 Tax=Branchiostoma belcheri TaxID=7741 RepID=A0A6P4YMI5_BRABE|nr:PREDICTED: uncharacterized protein LOC109470962 [Branchiostoma belcheri]
MCDFLLKLASCWCLTKDGKVSPGDWDEKAVKDVKGISVNAVEEDLSVDVAQHDGKIQREQRYMLNALTKCPSAPMSQPRPSKSSSDVLVQLREEGVLPLKCHGDAVAFEVPATAEEPSSPSTSKRPPRRPIKLCKLEERMEERRRQFKKKSAGSGTELRRELSNADVRRREILAERSRKLADQTEKKAAKVTAKKPSGGTAFVLTSVSDSDVIATRESREMKALERRLALRRARVAKRASWEDQRKRQEDAAERRQVQVEATVAKAKKLAAGPSVSPVSEEEDPEGFSWDQEPLETYEPDESDLQEYVF